MADKANTERIGCRSNITSQGISQVEFNDAVEVDEAAKAFEILQRDAICLDAITSQRLLRRVDLVVMPILCIVYGVQFLDRTSLSYSSVMGIQKDLGLVGQDYAWLSSVFFFSFLGTEFLTGRLLQRFPVGKYLGTSAIIWGIITICFAAAHNYSSAIAIRFVLGMLQACVSPALILIISKWYTKAEQISRTAVWVSSGSFAQIFGGVVAYGIAHGNTVHQFTVAPWKVVFILFGCLSVVIGVLTVIMVPDNQLSARWLSPNDRILAVERVRSNEQGIGNRKFKLYQFKEALWDPFSWAIFIFAIAANVPNGGLTNFFSQLIVSFGFTPQQSLLYGTPAGAVGILVLFAWGLLSQRYGHRILWGVAALATAMIGVILIVALPIRYPAGRLVGYYLTMAIPAGEASLLSLISSNVAGYTKKTTISALFFVGYCVGNIIGPQTFRAKDAPHYVPAEISIIVLLSVCILDILFIYLYLNLQNQMKEKKRKEADYVKKIGMEFWDLTDHENPEFVYSL